MNDLEEHFMIELHINDFLRYMDGDNVTPCVIKAIEELKSVGGGRLLFDKREYRFREGGCKMHVCNVSNNQHGMKAIVFPFIDATDITIDGGGATFLFFGGIFPFAADRASRITLQNFSIAYDRPFHTEGKVVSVNEEAGYFDMLVDEDTFPVKIEDGRMVAVSESYEGRSDIPYLITEFYHDKKSMVHGHGAHVLNCTKPEADNGLGYFNAERVDGGVIRITMPSTPLPYEQSIMTFQNEGRFNCAIFFNRSESITVRDVNVFECAGMGVIMQRTRDILVERVAVRLREFGEDGFDENRCVSITADATHFVNCTGSLELKDCVLMNMLDDGTNVHGVYTTVGERLAKNKLVAFYPNYNISAYEVGETVSFVEQRIMKRVFDAVITETERLDGRNDVLTFDREIPEYIGEGYAIENRTAMPDRVHLHGCRVGNNRPRGFLITTSGKVLVENNVFTTPAWAIEMAADANFWYESGQTDEVEIKNNRFIDCGSVFGGYTIEIVPSVPEGDEKFHGVVSIHDNEFIGNDGRVLRAERVKSLNFIGNEVLTLGGESSSPKISISNTGIDTLGGVNIFDIDGI